MKVLRNQWKRGLFLVMIAILTVGLVAGCGTTSPKQDSDQSGENKTINIGYVSWAEDVAVSNLWKVLLEEKGYTVNLTLLDVAPLFVGLNKGDLDVFLDAWLPFTHKSYIDKYQDNLDDYGTWYEGEAKIGLVVPNYVDIDSVAELKAKKDQFDGKIFGIDPGANMMKTTDELVENYDLNYAVIRSSETAMMAALDKAYRDEKWIVITGWSPHWMFSEYDLKYLEEPKKLYGESEGIHTLANKGFTKNNPEVAEMLKSFKLDDQQLGSLESLINEGMDPLDASKKWLEKNRALADSWMK